MHKPYVKIEEDGNFYYKDKEMTILHREDGPAVEYVDGDTFWYSNGEAHREDGPAAEYADGSKEWWVHGKLHREDGPAVLWPSGNGMWYLNDKRLSEEEFNTRKNNE